MDRNESSSESSERPAPEEGMRIEDLTEWKPSFAEELLRKKVKRHRLELASERLRSLSRHFDELLIYVGCNERREVWGAMLPWDCVDHLSERR